MTIEYRPNRLIVVVDSLRRKRQLVAPEEENFPTLTGSQVQVMIELQDKIKER